METELRQINELLAIAEYEMRQLRGLSEALMDQVEEAKKGLDRDEANRVQVTSPQPILPQAKERAASRKGSPS